MSSGPGGSGTGGSAPSQKHSIQCKYCDEKPLVKNYPAHLAWPGNIQTKIKTIGLEKVVKVYSHSSLSVVGALMMQSVKIRKKIAVAVVTLQ